MIQQNIIQNLKTANLGRFSYNF